MINPKFNDPKAWSITPLPHKARYLNVQCMNENNFREANNSNYMDEECLSQDVKFHHQHSMEAPKSMA